jgi:hypothetical protein
MPSLVSVLINKEKKKGSPLTKSEVLDIRENAITVALPHHVAKEVESKRGYADIDPSVCWEEWQKIRITFQE